MIVFQYVSLSILACLALLTGAALSRGRLGRQASLIWTLVWVAAAIAIAWPDATSFVANLMGVGRGADLVLYTSVLLMMGGFLVLQAQLRRIEHRTTLLVRQMALTEATAKRPTGTVTQ